MIVLDSLRYPLHHFGRHPWALGMFKFLIYYLNQAVRVVVTSIFHCDLYIAFPGLRGNKFKLQQVIGGCWIDVG